MQLYPHSFPLSYQHDNHVIEYKESIEICQGGPEVGKLWIDGLEVTSKLFGGPPLFYDDYVILPVLVSKFIGRGFRVAIINLKSKKISVIGKILELILPFKIEDNKIYYFTDLENSEQEWLVLSEATHIYPVNFPASYRHNDHIVEYKGFTEISQGGPEVGKLWIDGIEIKNLLFGGPLLFFSNYAIVPARVSTFFRVGFRIALINLENKKIRMIGKMRPLILPFKIEDNKVFYFTNVQNTEQGCLDLFEEFQNRRVP